MNSHNEFPFLKTEDVLSVFDNNTGADPSQLYREFIRKWVENKDCNNDFLKLIKGANQERENMYEPGFWVIGSRKFVKDAIEQDSLKRARVAQHKILGWGHDNLAQYVCSLTSVNIKDIRTRGRMDSISDARKLFCYFAVKVLDMTRIETALKLNVTRTAVAYLARQGEKIALERNIQLPLSPI